MLLASDLPNLKDKQKITYFTNWSTSNAVHFFKKTKYKFKLIKCIKFINKLKTYTNDDILREYRKFFDQGIPTKITKGAHCINIYHANDFIVFLHLNVCEKYHGNRFFKKLYAFRIMYGSACIKCSYQNCLLK